MAGDSRLRALIVVVQQNKEEQRALAEAIQQSDIPLDMLFFEDGQDFFTYFRNGNDSGWRAPSLFLLDLNMLVIDGRSVLQWVKSDRKLRMIPAIVFATSPRKHDISMCYELRANSFILMPWNSTQLEQHMKRVIHYWCRLVTLPDLDSFTPVE